MRILAIETSCDETGAAVLEASGTKTHPRFHVLSNVVASQVKIHQKFGGVVPNLAKREHQKNLVPLLLKALKDAKLLHKRPTSILRSIEVENYTAIFSHEPELCKSFLKTVPKIVRPKIDAIAATCGPGLAPALWTGVNFARALSLVWNKPIIPVNHLEGHIYINVLKGRKIAFPALALIVSGGHTELVLMRRHVNYKIIGETRDDAAGECFDKTARLLKLGYPGGPIISKLAEAGDSTKIPFPSPMLNSKDFDFSFSGLKTSVLYKLRNLETILPQTKRDIAASFERAVVNVLVAKTIRAAKGLKAKTVILGGGVAANKKLRSDLAKAVAHELPHIELLLPEISETTDNALMIAAAAFYRRNKKSAWSHLRADPSLRLG